MTGFQIFKRVIRDPIFLVSFLLILPVMVNAQGELPDTPNLVRVSWDHSTDAVSVEWEASKDPTVDLYILYIPDGDGWRDIYTFGSETFNFNITNNSFKGLTYIVTAMDTLDGSDDRESLLGENPHKAIEISLEFDPCSRTNIINWTAYVGWEGKISAYQIYGGLAGGEMEDMGFVNPNTLTFSHHDVSYDTAYQYYIEAINPTDTSHSPIAEIQSGFPDSPDILRIDEVSVLNNHSLELRFTADVDGPVNNFRILRSSGPDAPYSVVETIWNSSQPHMDYIDNVPTSGDSYKYMVQSIYKPESCTQDITVSNSNIGTSVLLESSVEAQIAMLNWTPYEDYLTGLSGYIVQRRSGGGEFIDMVNLGPETTSWQEPIESVINGYQPGEVQYKVLAMSMQVDGDDPGISASNIVSVFVETSMQVPNAFTPGRSSNYLFKPVIDFAPSKYRMIIYDRGGRKLFETSDPSEGWDGTFNGADFAMEGVYVYFIQYTDYTGLSSTLSGNVTVIYPAEY